MIQELNAVYNCDENMTTSSRKTDLMFLRRSRVTADFLLREGPADFADVFGESDPSPAVGIHFPSLNIFYYIVPPFFKEEYSSFILVVCVYLTFKSQP